MAAFGGISRGPNFSMGDDGNSMLNDFLAYKNSRDVAQQNFESNLRTLQQQQRMRDMISANAPAMRTPTPSNGMNVVFHDSPMGGDPAKLSFDTPLTKLDLAARVAAEKDKNADEDRALKEKLGLQSAFTPMKTAGGDIQLFDKKTGTVKDTGVASGTLTDSQKFGNTVSLENTKESNREQLENTRQTNRKSNIETRGQQLIKSIEAKGAEARKTKATASPNAPKDLPTQQRTAESLRANQFINSNPDLGKFVHIDPNTGLVTVDASSGGLFGIGTTGLSPANRAKIMDAIYGQRPAISEGPNNAPVPATNDIYVTKNGQRFKLNNPAQLEQALKQGYQQVK